MKYVQLFIFTVQSQLFELSMFFSTPYSLHKKLLILFNLLQSVFCLLFFEQNLFSLGS